jgi:hypothetical protein
MKQGMEENFRNTCLNLINERGVSCKDLENRLVEICESSKNIKNAQNLMKNILDEAQEINESLLKRIVLVQNNEEINTKEIKNQVLDMFNKEYKRTYDSILDNFKENNDYEMVQ